MEGINYNAINFNKLENKQIGLGDDVKAEKDSLKDGLTQKEMKKLDKDGDGVLTEAEFKAACKGNDKVKDKYWDAYADFCGLKSSKTESGGTKVSQNVKGQKANTYFDKDGEATKQSVKNGDGTRTVTDLKTGTEKIVQKDGSYTKYYENGTQVSVSVNGTKVKTNDDGQITKIVSKTEDGKENVNSFKYNDKGEMTKVTINGQEYTNGENCTITVKEDGKTVVKDKDGKNLLVTKQDENNNTIVYNYENGKKAEAVKVDSDGNALTTASYENGLKISKTNCKNSNVRTYERDAEGNLTKSTDTSKDGVKLSEQTYTKVNGESKWATRTFFDEKGSVEKTKNYEYSTWHEPGEEGSYTQRVTTLDKKGKETKTTLNQYNKYGNITSKETIKDGKEIKTEYKYDNDNANQKLQGYTSITYPYVESDEAYSVSPLKKEEYSSSGELQKTITYENNENGELKATNETANTKGTNNNKETLASEKTKNDTSIDNKNDSKEVIKNEDGSKTTINHKTGVTRQTAVDGTYTRTNKDGNLIEVSSDPITEFKYNKENVLTSVNINGNEYDVENGIAKNKKGEIVFKIKTNNETGNTELIYYNKGQKNSKTVLDKDGKLLNSYEYDKNGNLKTKTNHQTNKTKTYNKDGSTTVVNYENDTKTETTADGISVTIAQGNRIKKLTTENKNGEKVTDTFDYEHGTFNKATIDGKEYINGKNCQVKISEYETKDGWIVSHKYEIKDKNGKSIATIDEKPNGEIIVTKFDNNGKVAVETKINKNGIPEWSRKDGWTEVNEEKPKHNSGWTEVYEEKPKHNSGWTES